MYSLLLKRTKIGWAMTMGGLLFRSLQPTFCGFVMIPHSYTITKQGRVYCPWVKGEASGEINSFTSTLAITCSQDLEFGFKFFSTVSYYILELSSLCPPLFICPIAFSSSLSTFSTSLFFLYSSLFFLFYPQFFPCLSSYHSLINGWN